MTIRMVFLASLAFALLSCTFNSAFADSGWYQQSCPVSVNLRGVDFVDPYNGWICGDAGTILRTTDGGETWVQQDLGSTLAVTDIDFADLSNGYAAGALDTVWRTTDGGASWTMIMHYEQAPAISSVAVLDPQTVWITGHSDEGYMSIAFVAVTTDAGAHWSSGSIQSDHGTSAHDLAALSAQTAFVTVGIRRYDYSWYSVLFKTTNGGASFEGVSSLSHPYEEVQFLDPQVGFYGPTWEGPEAGEMKRTTDGGTSWTRQYIPDLYAAHMSFMTADLGWIACYDGKIARTTDGGATWVQQASWILQPLEKIQFVNADVGTAVGGNGTILHTVTGGMSGTDVAVDPWVRGGHLLVPQPNPSAGPVRLSYLGTGSGEVRIGIFDPAGRLLRELTGGSACAGWLECVWDGRNASGDRAAPGVYLVRASGPGGTAVRTVTITR